MTTARVVVTETGPLPYPDHDWTAIAKVYLVDDAIESWQVVGYVLHLQGQRPRRFAPTAVETPFLALAGRLQRKVAEWLNANGPQVERTKSGQNESDTD